MVLLYYMYVLSHDVFNTSCEFLYGYVYCDWWFFRLYPKNLQTLHFNYNLLMCKIKIFPNNYQVL